MNKTVLTVAPLAQAFYDAIERFPSARELAREIIDCCQAGASVVHLHVVDEQGKPTFDTSFFREVFRIVREECDIIVQGSTGGVSDLTRDERSISVEVPVVQMGSLNMGSVNLGETCYANTPGDVEYWAEKMLRHNVVPEMTFFEPGMINMADRLLEKGLVKRPLVVNVAINFPGGLRATPESILFMVSRLPEGAVWTLTPHHVQDFSLHALSVARGGNVRVGFEDSMYLDPDRRAANNVELVAKARDLIRLLGREVATPAETRKLYGITKE